MKWLENLIIKRLIKRVKEELPEAKQHALEIIMLKKDEVIEKVREAIKSKVLELVEKIQLLALCSTFEMGVQNNLEIPRRFGIAKMFGNNHRRGKFRDRLGVVV